MMSQNENLYTLLIKTQLLVVDGDTRFFQKYNLGNTRYNTLVHLHANPGLSQNDLSARLLCTKGNTTRIVKAMEKEGYLRREVDEKDTRFLCLFLTEKGERLLAEVSAAYQKFNDQRFGCLNDLQKDTFKEHLTALANHMEALLQSS
jgi:DNA-binding MarR family transcriptional regulator